MEKLHLKNISKSYGVIKAVKNLSLSVLDGELLAILGPSGCGKSTLLSCIAGIEKPDVGDISLNKRRLFSHDEAIDMPPEKRKIGFVFQSYALWPHMSVFDNIAYPLKMAKIPHKVRKEIVKKNLELVELSSKTERFPHELSGGEMQRVALSRALVMSPDLLLLDEPLSNLDARLRENMQVEIRNIQKELKLTVIHVTHDQAEAMAMADRIAVMHKGAIIQTGSPEEIYESPTTQFVASFVGLNNILTGVVDTRGESIYINGNTHLRIPIVSHTPVTLYNAQATVSVRPEDVMLGSNKSSRGIVTQKTYKGSHIEYVVQSGDISLKVQSHPTDQYKVGDEVDFMCKKCVIIDH